jgi:hypothetical protein
MARPETNPPRAEKARIILVEGKDDELVVRTISRQERLEDRIQVLTYAQSAKLIRFLDVLVRDSGFENVVRLGLTKDADDNVAGAIQSLQIAWQTTSQTLTQLARPVPQCDWFVVPDNENPGRLEDLCLRSVTYPHILRLARVMYWCSTALVPYKMDREKSLVACYLSMMRQNGLQLGTGAQAGCFDLNSSAFTRLREFVVSVGI